MGSKNKGQNNKLKRRKVRTTTKDVSVDIGKTSSGKLMKSHYGAGVTKSMFSKDES